MGFSDRWKWKLWGWDLSCEREGTQSIAKQQRKKKITVLPGHIFEKCCVRKVLCISTSAHVCLNWQHPSPSPCPTLQADLFSSRAALQWCKALWTHSSGHPFLPVSSPKSYYPFSSPLGNELVNSEAPSPDASFVPGKQQLSHYQAWSFERLLKEGIRRNPVTLCLSLICRNPEPSTHL